MNISTRTVPLLFVLIGLTASGCGDGTADSVGTRDYEVWVVDQSDSPGQPYGGRIFIYDGPTLVSSRAGPPDPIETIDLSLHAGAVCEASTGALPVRPHMLLFNSEETHAVLSFVASGHVVIFDAETRQPLDCFRATQSATGQQAHAAFPAPDGSYILVANQNGRRLERIDADFAANRFVYNFDATLDLANCTTPNGFPCEAPELRPLNWPICPIVDETGDHAFVTLRGGGMLVVDPRQTPMTIVAEYDVDAVNGNGCGGVEAGGYMYLNSGGSPVNVSQESMEHPALYGFDVYRFPLSGYSASNPVNTPAPELVYSKSGPGDSHGMVATADGGHIWVFDRHANTAEVISTSTGAHVETLPLAGPLSDDPAPDLVDIAPDGSHLFVALRGPTPLSGDPHNARGATPGIGILRLAEGGATGEFLARIPVVNVDGDGIERADVHAVRVRGKR
jgi:hypothetical protein